jgi:hypothetical protein
MITLKVDLVFDSHYYYHSGFPKSYWLDLPLRVLSSVSFPRGRSLFSVIVENILVMKFLNLIIIKSIEI